MVYLQKSGGWSDLRSDLDAEMWMTTDLSNSGSGGEGISFETPDGNYLTFNVDYGSNISIGVSNAPSNTASNGINPVDVYWNAQDYDFDNSNASTTFDYWIGHDNAQSSQPWFWCVMYLPNQNDIAGWAVQRMAPSPDQSVITTAVKHAVFFDSTYRWGDNSSWSANTQTDNLPLQQSLFDDTAVSQLHASTTGGSAWVSQRESIVSNPVSSHPIGTVNAWGADSIAFNDWVDVPLSNEPDRAYKYVCPRNWQGDNGRFFRVELGDVP